MESRTQELIEQLAQRFSLLEQPIHLVAICTGGLTLARTMATYLKARGVTALCYEVWVNISEGKREIWKTDFKEANYDGTAVIVEDVIWEGGSIQPVRQLLLQLNDKKRPYVAALLDCNSKADFAVFR